MELHLVFELRSTADATPHRDQYPAMLDIAEWADERGFAYVNFGEHHVSESGYLPSPLVTCAAVAGRTTQIRMRPNVLLTPFYNPIRLAEDAAVLSLVSGGRFDLVLGGGYRQRECDLYGTDLKDRWRTIGDTVKFLRQAWSGEPFNYQGRTIFVRPIPETPPTLFLGGGGEAAARRAARIADSFSTPHSEALWQPFREECLKVGRPDPGPAKPLGPVFLWVADDVDKAWDLLMPYVISQIKEYNAFTVEGYGEAAGPYKSGETAAEVRQNPAYRVLTPNEAIELGRQLGPRGVFLINPLLGGIPPTEAWRMLELFDNEVRPHLPTSEVEAR
ncbi:LLM class flavin-dependent oxidoreductase [Mycobacterium sp. BMJ-28]